MMSPIVGLTQNDAPCPVSNSFLQSQMKGPQPGTTPKKPTKQAPKAPKKSPWHLGWRPDRDPKKEVNPGYMHLTANDYGLKLGGGLHSGKINGNDADLLNANAKLGKFKNGKDTRYGVKGDVNGVSLSSNNKGDLNGSIKALHGKVDAHCGNDGCTLGVGGSIIEGDVTVGDKIPTKDSKNDTSLKAGLGLGLGLGGRLHSGDKDGDGIRELGFGFDLGPVSFDMKSELLGRLLPEKTVPLADMITSALPKEKKEMPEQGSWLTGMIDGLISDRQQDPKKKICKPLGD
jgi:hypothetical protein